MHKPRSIQIAVDNPCHQNWDEMTVAGNGRFCNNCSKTVVDFTTWSDAALYQFFAKNDTAICGRFLNTQLYRHISIPHQPHSRLYRMTVALGLTLICTQTPAMLAQSRPQAAARHTDTSVYLTTGDVAVRKESVARANGTVYGNVTDDGKEPLISVRVQLFQGNELMGNTYTDYDGNYTIKPLSAGSYDILVTFAGYDTVSRKNIIVNGDSVLQNIVQTRKPSLNYNKAYITMGVRTGLVSNIVETELSGHVTMDGRPLPAAEVRVYDHGTPVISIITDHDGNYRFANVEPGLYELHILHDGYHRQIVKNVRIARGQRERNITLRSRSKK